MPFSWRTPVGLALVAGLYFAVQAGGRDLSHIDEHRYAEVAREMAEPDGNWVVPQLDGERYDSKPPGFFWAAAIAQRSGLDLPTASRLPSVVAAAATLVALYGIARRLYGGAAANASVVVLATTALFSSLARRVDLDMMLTAFTTGSLYAGLRAAREERHHTAWLALAGLLSGLGVLVKGPVAWMVPGVTILAWLASSRRLSAVTLRESAIVLVPALAPISLWLLAAALRAGPEYVKSIALGHGVGHPLGAVDKLRPFWFYAVSLPQGLLPWTLLLPAAFLALRREGLAPGRSDPEADRFAVAWLLAPLLVLSMLPAKRHLYLLPIYPAAALLVGRLAAMLRERDRSADPSLEPGFVRAARLGVSAVAGAAVVAGGAFALAGLAFAVARALPRSVFDGAPSASAALSLVSASGGLALAALAFALGTLVLAGGWRALGAATPAGQARGLALATLASALLASCVVHPLETGIDGQRDFLEAVRARVGDAPLADYGGLDFATNWTLRRRRVPRLRDERQATLFLEENAPRGGALVVEADELAERGMPRGAQVLLVWPRPFGTALVLLGADRAS
ncbi:MAG TPA: glycosyltransferase family 39 protein [Myxococcota bacterium]|nr:glycosyltransferase family 39 protein [Myxococcota bacterium]